jgi:hypothetical protein
MISIGLTKKRKKRTREYAPLLQNTRDNKGLQPLVHKVESVFRKPYSKQLLCNTFNIAKLQCTQLGIETVCLRQ